MAVINVVLDAESAESAAETAIDIVDEKFVQTIHTNIKEAHIVNEETAKQFRLSNYAGQRVAFKSDSQRGLTEIEGKWLEYQSEMAWKLSKVKEELSEKSAEEAATDLQFLGFLWHAKLGTPSTKPCIYEVDDDGISPVRSEQFFGVMKNNLEGKWTVPILVLD